MHDRLVFLRIDALHQCFLVYLDIIFIVKVHFYFQRQSKPQTKIKRQAEFLPSKFYVAYSYLKPAV